MSAARALAGRLPRRRLRLAISEVGFNSFSGVRDQGSERRKKDPPGTHREVYSMSQQLAISEEPQMKTAKFTYWQEGDYYLGFLNDYPDYETQGMSKEELISNLRDLLADLES